MICHACGVIQPPAALHHFARLGLETSFAQPPGEIARQHRARLRRTHPDRVTTRTPRQRRYATEHTTALNDARRILSDPLRRARYLIGLRGVAIETDGVNRLPLSPACRVDLEAVRTAIAELNAPDDLEERAKLTRSVALEYERSVARLGEALDAEPEAGPLTALAQEAIRLDHMRRLLDEIQS